MHRFFGGTDIGRYGLLDSIKTTRRYNNLSENVVVVYGDGVVIRDAHILAVVVVVAVVASEKEVVRSRVSVFVFSQVVTFSTLKPLIKFCA